MTRQEQLKEIGEMIPKDFMSYFIIPLPHNFYENNSNIFSEIEKTDWDILNDTKKFEGRQLGAYNIKAYIYENMIPTLDEKTHINKYNNLLLNKKFNRKAKIDIYEFEINEVDLWIFDEHVAFFTIKIKIDHTKYSINQLSEFNKQFREFKFLDLNSDSDELLFSRVVGFAESANGLLEFLIKTTHIDGKSFLKIDREECDVRKNKNCQENPLYTISNTSTNAKVITAVQTKATTFVNEDEIEQLQETALHFSTINGTSILEEVPFYLASCSSLNPAKGFMNNDLYIHTLVNNGGLNIWKYSSGITIHDSIALFGLADDGGPVVSNMKNQFYFVYMLNLYINFQARFIENKLINEEFESLDISYWYKKLQKLKNQFITKDIGIKFQENAFHQSIVSALETDVILSEVTNNLMETKEITQNNIGIYITLAGFIFVSIFEEPIKNFISNNASEVAFVAIAAAIVWYKKRRAIKRWFRSIKTKIFR